MKDGIRAKSGDTENPSQQRIQHARLASSPAPSASKTVACEKIPDRASAIHQQSTTSPRQIEHRGSLPFPNDAEPESHNRRPPHSPLRNERGQLLNSLLPQKAGGPKLPNL